MQEIPVHHESKFVGCTILVVDEDEAMRALLVDVLEENGCRVIESSDGNGALEMLQTITPNVIVTDLKIPDGGFLYLRLLKAAATRSAIVVMTAHGDSQSKAQAFKCGAKGYFEKPLHLKDLKDWIAHRCIGNPCGNIEE